MLAVKNHVGQLEVENANLLKDNRAQTGSIAVYKEQLASAQAQIVGLQTQTATVAAQNTTLQQQTATLQVTWL